MKKHNLVLQTALAACFAVVATSASAVVALSSTVASTPVKYATELTVANTTVTGAGLNLTFSPAWGVAAGNHLYVRVDLTNAQFGTALTAGSLVATTAAAGAKAASVVSLSAGGIVGGTSVIFDVSDSVLGMLLTDVLTLTPVSIKYLSPSTAANVTVNVYDSAAAANAGGAGLGFTLTDAYITTAAALVTTYTPLTNTAQVSQSFKNFAANAAGVNTANTVVQALGSVQTVVNAAGALVPVSGAAAVAADLATASDLVVTGVFSSVGTTGSVALSAAGTCVALTAGTLNATKTTATFTGFAGATLVPALPFVCLTADGVLAVPAQVDTGVLTFTAAAGATVPAASGTVGTILHDGTELQTPWFSTASGYVSRVFLTNSGATAAAISGTTILTETGNTCTAGTGAPTSIPANSMISIDATSLCASFTGNTRAAAIFTIEQPTTQIQGVYQIINPTTGAQMAYPLLRPGMN